MGTCYTLAPGTSILEGAVTTIAGNFVLKPMQQNWGAINVGKTLNEVLTWRWQWTLPVTASTYNLRLVTAKGYSLFVLLPINDRPREYRQAESNTWAQHASCTDGSTTRTFQHFNLPEIIFKACSHKLYLEAVGTRVVPVSRLTV